jgi:outer membrane protein assembly factor BamE (lipoprotein component of BamABCDE complex)
MKWLSLLLVVLLGFSFACAPTVLEGKKIDAENLKQLNVGQSDKAKVEQLFGKPAKVETVSPGVEKYIYTYRVKDPEWYTIDKTQGQAFEVWFQNGTLVYYKLRTEGQEAILKQ